MDCTHDNAMRGKAFGRLDLLRTESKPPSLIFAKSDSSSIDSMKGTRVLSLRKDEEL